MKENTRSHASEVIDSGRETRVTHGIIFSKDRALQLAACIDSFLMHCRDAGRVRLHVLYMCSESESERQYNALKRAYPDIIFLRETAFRDQILQTIGESTDLLFLVDDNIFVGDFCLPDLTEAMDGHPDAIGFSLRLGANTVYSYSLDKKQAIPAFQETGGDICTFNWTKADGDFSYPLEVSSSLYRTSDILDVIGPHDFTNPNTLEALLAGMARRFTDSRPSLLCFRRSVSFCAPVNMVQTVYDNRAGGRPEYSPGSLAAKFSTGCRIDVSRYAGFIPGACHQEVDLFLVPSAEKLPAVSIIIPCYNLAHLIGETVDSVVSQSFQDWECIIVNDGSTDNTRETAMDITARHGKRFHLVETVNRGLANARNLGISHARGKYILPLDADDMIKPAMLETTVGFLEANPDFGIVSTYIQHFGLRDDVWATGPFSIEIEKANNVLPYCSLYRREVYDSVGGYNSTTLRSEYEDWDFWLGAMEKGWQGHILEDPLFCYRKRGEGLLKGANERRNELMAQLVMNHPSIYSLDQRIAAYNLLRSVYTFTKDDFTELKKQQKFRITYLIHSLLGVTGGNLTLIAQCNEMIRRGHTVTIVSYTPKPPYFSIAAEVVVVPAGKSMADYVPKSDIVIGTYFMNAIELQDISAPVKVYYAQGDQYIFDDSLVASHAHHAALKRISRQSCQQERVWFVPNSFNLAEAVKNKYGKNTDAILPVCVDRRIYHPLKKSDRSKTPRLLIVGPDVRGSETEPLTFKGMWDIREALKILDKNDVAYKVVRISSSPMDIFSDIECEFHIAPADSDKTILYGTSDIMIYASHYDSCPRPPMEAMASGVAVVCTDTPGAREYCVHDKNCILVPIKSPERIADAVIRLLKDDGHRKRIIEGGLKTADQYPVQREWQTMEDLLYRFFYLSQRQVYDGSFLRNRLLSLTSNAIENARQLFSSGKIDEAIQLLFSAIHCLADDTRIYYTIAEIMMAVRLHQDAFHILTKMPVIKEEQRHRELIAYCLEKIRETDKIKNQRQRTLSLCMILKDEAGNLPKFMKAAAPFVSEIIAVDTGSEDGTVQIAERFGASVFTFAWTGDFAAARNYSLSKASGDWILVLDADEVIAPRDFIALRGLIDQAPENVAYSMDTRNYITDFNIHGWMPNDGTYPDEEAGTGWFASSKVRLFPRLEKISFSYPVHELVEDSLMDIGVKIMTCPIPIHHYGKLNRETDIAKGEVYYNLGRAKLEQNENDVRFLTELAVQAGGLGKTEEALDLWRKVTRLNPDDAFAHLNIGGLLIKAGRYAESLEASEKARQLNPHSRGILYNVSIADFFSGNYKKAISGLDIIIQNSPEYLPAQVLKAAAFCLEGNREKAISHLTILRDKGISCGNFLNDIAELMISRGNKKSASMLLEMLSECNQV